MQAGHARKAGAGPAGARQEAGKTDKWRDRAPPPLRDYRSDPEFGHVRVLGAFNEILTEPKNISPGAVIANFCFVGRGARIGRSKIGNFCEINSGARIGDGNLINAYCVFNSDTEVGDGNIFGANVMTADEKYMTARTENVEKAPCRIGSDCRIGQGARLICTELGDHVSIGAGAVVLEPRISSGEVWAGIPARYIRKMTEKELSI